jgi:hypothetical protein
VADEPSNVHLQIAGSDRLVTADGYGTQHTLGLDRAMVPVNLSITGTGTSGGPVLPVDTRLVLVGFGIDWAAAPTANVAALVEIQPGGNGPMQTTDSTTWTQVSPIMRVSAGAGPGTMFFSGFRMVTVASNGSTSPIRANVTAAGGADVTRFLLLVYAINALNVPCPS